MRFLMNNAAWPSQDAVTPPTAPSDAPGECLLRFHTDGTPKLLMRVWNFTSSALTKNQPYVLTYSGAASGNLAVLVGTTACTGKLINLGLVAFQSTTSSGAFTTCHVVVADEAIATSGCGFVCVAGYHDVLVDGSGTAIAVGDTLRLAPSSSSTALVQDVAVSGLGPNQISPRSVGVAQAAASAAATTVRCYLFGEPVVVAP